MYVAKLKNASSQGGLFLQKVSKRSSTNEDKWGLCSKNSTHRCPLFRFAPPGTIIPSYPAFHDITCQAKLGSQIAIAAFHTSGALSVGAPLETFWNLKHANTPAKKTGRSCCTHWPSQNSRESIEESKPPPDCLDYTPTEITWEIDGCSVMSLTVTECHGESTMGLSVVPFITAQTLSAMAWWQPSHWSPPWPSVTWFSWASPVEHESSMHGVLFPVVFAPEHRRILLIHYSILYQIVLVRFNVSILKQVDVHLV